LFVDLYKFEVSESYDTFNEEYYPHKVNQFQSTDLKMTQTEAKLDLWLKFFGQKKSLD